MAKKLKLENAFNTSRSFKTPKGAAGYDNPRENIDPHVRTKVVSTLEYWSRKARITPDGAFCIKLTNKTGSPSVVGQIVEINSAQNDSFKTATANSFFPIGIIINGDIADSQEVWVCNMGICDVLIDAGGCAVGDRMTTSATSGSADVGNTPSTADHFKEIGHCIQTRVGAGLARLVIHFL